MTLFLLGVSQALVSYLLIIIDTIDFWIHFTTSLWWNVFTFGFMARAKDIPAKMPGNHKESSIRNWILITGCSTGIGRAAAIYFGSPSNGGYRVFATVRSSKDETELLKLSPLDRWGKKTIFPILMDVTDDKSVSRAAKLVKDRLETDGSRLVGLINNAGISAPGVIELTRIDAFKIVFDVNVLGIVRTTQAFLPLLRSAKGARIINIGSLAGLISPPGLGPYCATKYAVEALSDSLSAELACQNITVSVVEPGQIITPIQQKAVSALTKDMNLLSPVHAKLYHDRILAFARMARDVSPYFSVDTTATNRALGHALLSPFPKKRYLVGLDARLLTLLKTWLPSQIYDLIVQSV